MRAVGAGEEDGDHGVVSGDAHGSGCGVGWWMGAQCNVGSGGAGAKAGGLGAETFAIVNKIADNRSVDAGVSTAVGQMSTPVYTPATLTLSTLADDHPWLRSHKAVVTQANDATHA